MQAGVTHCIDKSWTRIYNPEQAAVERCDPQGEFIKKWVPELAHVSPVQLGLPPRVKGYPTPILNYREARQRRVKQLEEQRSHFRQQTDILPFLARMPDSVVPFGCDRVESEILWAQQPTQSLFPPPLNLDTLDLDQSKALRTWLVAHIDIKPHRNSSRRQTKPDSNIIQLSLLE
jgi:deoxyribodipyrimidine photo-lyase